MVTVTFDTYFFTRLLVERVRANIGRRAYEIIVVDDCSKDKTVAVVNGLIKQYSTERIKLLRLAKNHGKGGAIRKGVMRASGALVQFADADGAVADPDWRRTGATGGSS